MVSFIGLADRRPVVIDTALSYIRLIITVGGKRPLLQLVALAGNIREQDIPTLNQENKAWNR